MKNRVTSIIDSFPMVMDVFDEKGVNGDQEVFDKIMEKVGETMLGVEPMAKYGWWRDDYYSNKVEELDPILQEIHKDGMMTSAGLMNSIKTKITAIVGRDYKVRKELQEKVKEGG